jgi:hypothetical protein
MDTITTQTNGRLLTRYYYKDNQLCFQILVSSTEKTSVVGEFANYSEYRKSFASFQQQMETNNVIDLNTYSSQRSFSQVA